MIAVEKITGKESILDKKTEVLFMNIVADLHTHTIMSGHAYGTVRENALAASEKGLKVLGITEHAPGIPGTCDEIYFMNMKVMPRILYGVKMLYGCEINVLNNGQLSMSERVIQKLDYGIAGMHDLCYQNEGKEKNTENLISCMKHEKVKIVSHLDDSRMPLDYEKVVQAAKEYQVALEVNNSSMIKKDSRPGCYENYHEMLRLCMQYRVPIVVDSDAHDPYYVGEFQKAKELLQQVGFDEELIINSSVEKMTAFLGVKEITSEIPDMGV